MQIHLFMLENEQAKLQEYGAKMRHHIEELECLRNDVGKWCENIETIRMIEKGQSDLAELAGRMMQLGQSLKTIIIIYKETEKRLLRQAEAEIGGNAFTIPDIKHFTYLTHLLKEILGEE